MGKFRNFWKRIRGILKKQFTVEKLLDKYSDKLFEILMDKAEEAINNSQRGKYVATDIKINHYIDGEEGKKTHVFSIKIVVDKQQLIELLKRR